LEGRRRGGEEGGIGRKKERKGGSWKKEGEEGGRGSWKGRRGKGVEINLFVIIL
jgi:hypothetical protein